MQMTIYHTNESIEVRDVATPPTLKELQAAVGGGYIERVPMPEHWEATRVMFCNEEGLLNSMPYNSRASEIMHDVWLNTHDAAELDLERLHLVGPVVVLSGTPEEMEEL